VIKDSVKGFLANKGKAQTAEQGRNFSLVFIDPPYEVSNEELTENLTGLLEIISEDATVIVERSSRTPEPTWPDGYALEDRKDYGDTSVFWLSRG
jgi:16S rRNA (guanine966-N2)-methyltransferase